MDDNRSDVIRALDAALDYGVHKPDCAGRGADPNQCTCGWAAARLTMREVQRTLRIPLPRARASLVLFPMPRGEA